MKCLPCTVRTVLKLSSMHEMETPACQLVQLASKAERNFHARHEMGPALALQLANYKQLGLEVLGKVCLGES